MHIAPHLSQLAQQLQQDALTDGIQVCIVGAIIEKEGKVLIVTRASDEDLFPDHAEIPGGTVDPGETLLDAVVRETKEETGLDVVEIVGYQKGFDYITGSGAKARQFDFILRTTHYNVVLNPKEHSAFTWIAPTDKETLDPLLISSKMREVIYNIQLPSH